MAHGSCRRTIGRSAGRRVLPVSLVLVVLAAAGCGTDSDADDGIAFPAGFRWGTAISGFQADMGCPTLAAAACEDRRSDWYDFVTAPAIVADPAAHVAGDPVASGPGFWELYADDFARARQELNNDAFRLGIEWSRVFPAPTDGIDGYEALRAVADAAAVARYHDIFRAARANGLTLLVTLNHYSLPSWLHDAVGCHDDLDACTRRGWLDGERTVREIARYAGFCAREFGAEVDLWATLNEPLAPALAGYVLPSASRSQPPAVALRFREAKQIILSEIEAHARMYDAVHANDTADADGDGAAAEVGLVMPVAPFRPLDPNDALDRRGAANASYLWNDIFLDATIKGELDAAFDGSKTRRDDLAGRMDYLGVNYYFRQIIDGTATSLVPAFSPLLTFSPTSLSLTEDYPRGLHAMLLRVSRDYQLPIYVTENGTVWDRADASAYLVRHLTWVARAIRDGADVRGYFWWTFMDNYEWNHGMNEVRMGMYRVDADDPRKTRRLLPHGEVYAGIARRNRIDAARLAAWPEPE